MDTFCERAITAAKSFPGWAVKCSLPPAQLMVATRWRCPHGEPIDNGVSLMLLEQVPAEAEGFAEYEFRSALNECAAKHIGKPIAHFLPAGTYVESYSVDMSTPMYSGCFASSAAMQMVPPTIKVTGHFVMDGDETFQAWHKQIMDGHDAWWHNAGVGGHPSGPFPFKAIGQPQPSGVVAELGKFVPALNDEMATCPVCTGKSDRSSIANMIVHLNDTHKWKRERVADWLETLDVDLTIDLEKAS